MHPIYNFKLVLLIPIIFMFSWVSETFAGDEIIVLKTQNTSSYNQALDGLIGNLEKKQTPSEKIFIYDWSLITASEIIEQHPIENIRVIFSIGTNPTEAIVKDSRFDDVLKVFLMVMKPREKEIFLDENNPGNNLGGVTLDIPIEEQIELLKLLLPQLNRIGIIYSNYSADMASDLTQRLKKQNITVDSQFAEVAEQVPEVFSQIAENIDIFMFLLDTTIFNKSVQKYFFNRAYDYPICGLTKPHVNSGLLCSVSTDYISQGRQAADLFFRLEKDYSIPIESPNLIKLYVNEKTARELNIDIPPSAKIILIK